MSKGIFYPLNIQREGDGKNIILKVYACSSFQAIHTCNMENSLRW